MVSFLELDSQQLLAPTERLRNRIRDGFPDANLVRVADELVAVSRAHASRSAAIRRPSRGLRAAGIAAALLGAGILALAVATVHPVIGDRWPLSEVLQAVESTLGSIVFLTAAAAFVWTLDARQKRRRCLLAVHEMRAMAHIVDMHQLTKDPDRALHGGEGPGGERTLDRRDLVRYLDYCSEMLSLIGKVAALYVQGFPDPVALSAVDDVETLTTSLSRKIWQKIVILESSRPGA
jgi:hypothetical protein